MWVELVRFLWESDIFVNISLQVGLEFFVPAVQIPVKKSGDEIDIPSLLKEVNICISLKNSI